MYTTTIGLVLMPIDYIKNNQQEYEKNQVKRSYIYARFTRPTSININMRVDQDHGSTEFWFIDTGLRSLKFYSNIVERRPPYDDIYYIAG